MECKRIYVSKKYGAASGVLVEMKFVMENFQLIFSAEINLIKYETNEYIIQ